MLDDKETYAHRKGRGDEERAGKWGEQRGAHSNALTSCFLYFPTIMNIVRETFKIPPNM